MDFQRLLLPGFHSRRAVTRATSLACVLLLFAGCGGRERSTTAAPDSTSTGAALAWIQDYYRAINERRYRDAYTHWEQGGQASRKTFEEFRTGFDKTESVEVIVGRPGPVGAAAGSRYIEVPVRIVAREHDGSQQTYSGSYTLRLSVVDGATPEQRTWHIYSAQVRKL